MYNQDWKSPQQLIKGALFAALAYAIQMAPFYVPVVGASLSSLSTLPIALAAFLNVYTGVLTYFVTGLLLCLWSLPRALFFCCGAGLLGLSLGIMLKKGVKYLPLILVSGALLTAGLIFVSVIIDLPLIPWLQQDKRVFLVPLMLVWSTIYAAIWVPILRALLARLKIYL